MNDDQITEEMIKAKGLTAPRVHPERIKELLDRVIPTYDRHGTSTFCHAYLEGKFYLGTGHSACVSPENFNAEVGCRLAFKDMQGIATKKLWELEGYRLYTELKEQSDEHRTSYTG